MGKKTMQRLLAMLMTAGLTLGLVACSSTETPASPAPAASSQEAGTEAAAPGGTETSQAPQESADGEPYQIVIMPKIIGIDYYNAVENGVNEAKAELAGVADINWTGPTDGTVDSQIAMLSSLIATEPDAILVACNDTEAIVPTLKEAADAGIKVVTWDSDSASDRDLFVDLVEYSDFGGALIDDMASQINGEGKVAIITTSFTATNQVNWIRVIEEKIASEYPDIEIITTEAVGEDTQAAYEKATALMNSNADLAGIIVLGCPNVPGVAQAVEEAGKTGEVAVVGNGLPNSIRSYIESGTMETSEIWDATYHGYLTIYATIQLLQDGLAEGDKVSAGKLGDFDVMTMDDGTLTIAMNRLPINKGNVNDYDF